MGGLWFPIFLSWLAKATVLKDRWCETLSASRAVLLRADLRGLYARMRLEPHRIGATDADLYRVALMTKPFDAPYNLVLKLGYFHKMP